MWLIFILFVSVLSIILMTAKLKMHPFLALLAAAFGYGIFCGTLSLQELVNAINGGFGGTVGSIGIVILAGGIVGIGTGPDIDITFRARQAGIQRKCRQKDDN